MTSVRWFALAALTAGALPLGGCTKARIAPAPHAGGERCGPFEVIVTGRVVEEATGRPVPRAVVSIGGRTGRPWVTDSTGTYRLQLSTGEGYVVRASAIGFYAENREINLPGGGMIGCGPAGCPTHPCDAALLNFYLRPYVGLMEL